MGEKLSITEVFDLALKAHLAGKFQEAEAYYNIVLKHEPKHPDANHNMGILSENNDRIQDSIPFLKEQ